MKDLRINGMLLPILSDSGLQIPASYKHPIELVEESFPVLNVGSCKGDSVCVNSDNGEPTCRNNATCDDLFNKFRCNCVIGKLIY